MMELIRQYLLGIVVTALIAAVIQTVAPEGSGRRISRLAGSLVLLLAVLQPLQRWNPGPNTSYPGQTTDIREQIDMLEAEYRQKLMQSIAQRTAAYISGKGEELGVPCCPTVTTRYEEGIPYPDAVVMDIPYQAELSRCIAEELGIPAERQSWQEK